MKVSWGISTALAMSALSFTIPNVFAEENALDTIVVVGEIPSLDTTGLVGSMDILSQDELTYEHVDDTLELFNKVPGVYLSRFNQGIINTDISIRGFAGDGVTPHAKLLVDGIPTNLHNGYNELDQLFPLGISSIAVFKGTSDPRYGLFNIAGNYNVTTRQDDAREVELTIGSYDTEEVQAYAGFTHGKLIHSYSVGYRESEGYRNHTDLDKFAFSGSWAYEIDDTKDIRLIVRTSDYEGDSPGYLGSHQTARSHSRRSESFASQDGGEKETRHVSIHWSQIFNNDLEWELKTYSQTFERERWVRFSEGGSLQNRYDDQEQWGIISTLSLPLSDSWSLSWGTDYEYQDVLEQRFKTLSNDTRSRDRTPDGIIRDRSYDFTSYGSYLQLFHEPNEKLRWNVALRADRLVGDFKNRPTGETRDMFDFGTIVQPKFNIVYAPIDTVNLFANWGRGFQHPFGVSAYTSGDTNARDVSINDGWELGTQWTPSDSVTIRLSYWQQKARDEFVVIDGTSQNVGETERKGIDLAFNGQLNDDWSYWGSFTTIDSEIIKASDSNSAFEGNELRSIPDHTASIGLNYQITPRFIARVHLDAQGDYYVNEANKGGQYGDYAILNMSADYETNWGKIKLQLNNLTNEFYQYVFDFGNEGTSTIHSPGDGINGSLSISWNL